MNTVKKEIFLILITCALGIIAVIVDVIRHPLSYSDGNETYSLLWILSGYLGLSITLMGSLGFVFHSAWIFFVSPFLAWLSFPLTMICSKEIFVIKRIAFSFFITMYTVTILFYFIDYLVILKII